MLNIGPMGPGFFIFFQHGLPGGSADAGDEVKGGLSYGHVSKNIPKKEAPPEIDYTEDILREDKEIVEFVQFIIASGLLE